MRKQNKSNNMEMKRFLPSINASDAKMALTRAVLLFPELMMALLNSEYFNKQIIKPCPAR